MGHSVAVTDAAGSVFAAELIEAYPDAKVILNTRKDLKAWHRSATESIVKISKNWVVRLVTTLSREGFWAWQVYLSFMWVAVFRSLDGDVETGIARSGIWVYRGRFCAATRSSPQVYH